MIRDEYDYHLEDISKVVVKSQHKIKEDYHSYGISERDVQNRWSEFYLKISKIIKKTGNTCLKY